MLRRLLLLLVLLAAPATADPWRSEENRPHASYACGGSGEPVCSTSMPFGPALQPPEGATAAIFTVAVAQFTGGESTECNVVGLADQPQPLTDTLAFNLTPTHRLHVAPTVKAYTLTVLGGPAAAADVDFASTWPFDSWVAWLLPYRMRFAIVCAEAPPELELSVYYLFAR